MQEYCMGEYDIAVIGAGHAGCEAALASARLGAKTVLFTLSLDAVANLPCNPSIGGTAKGHLVREIDALGGQMGLNADQTFLQSRMLNRGKGPAVHSLRVQTDRRAYNALMKRVLEQQENLDLKQAEITAVRTDKQGHVCQVVTRLGAVYACRCAIVCTGTYLQGKIYVGDACFSSGPDAIQAANALSQSLQALGIALRRFKTGTPARVLRQSIDFSKLEEQPGDEEIVPFSFATNPQGLKNRVSCHIAYTNQETHRIITQSIGRSPLYGGKIEGIGPRYCPSIEDKVMRFADKPRHQLFIEPMGLDTEEMYLQGMSSSLPEDVQLAFYRSIKGLENVRITRSAYAIEYDCCDPLDLLPTLRFQAVPGLYGAGQFNGTSGYEEAAAQGLLAGINAARYVQGKKEIVLERANSYIGTLIDDLCTKGCQDPYRMMTSRSEYRLILRQDNADVRLTPLGYEIGLINQERYQAFLHKQAQVQKELARVQTVTLPPSAALNHMLEQKNTAPVQTGVRLIELLRRPQVLYSDLAPFDENRPPLPKAVCEQVEITVKYEGYIQKQLSQVRRQQKEENIAIPAQINYSKVSGLRLEAMEKLQKVRPLTVGQAMRISGVSPADIGVLLIYLKRAGAQQEETP